MAAHGGFRLVGALGVTAALVACSGSDPAPECTLVGSIPLTVDLAPDLGKRVETLSVELCRDGECEEQTRSLDPTRVPVTSWSAMMSLSLTARPVEASVRVTTVSGDSPPPARLTLVPEATHPNGPHCGTDYVARIRVAEDGTATQV
ncbi:hypothetical protein OG948_54970 (plasmid) [Embleya sp. NBC_00888]|uniref:hypothetical protein n=1 Tax=Embleya sp. NBC_00888 TaxID=2975960 RepID=UPI002F90B88C|nr:hypothetical protein OG948_54970 [Embleya sp. NBC_00888]